MTAATKKRCFNKLKFEKSVSHEYLVERGNGKFKLGFIQQQRRQQTKRVLIFNRKPAQLQLALQLWRERLWKG